MLWRPLEQAAARYCLEMERIVHGRVSWVHILTFWLQPQRLGEEEEASDSYTL